jgi:hypothetical protein
MRSFFYITTALAVIATAFWAYRENYRTQAALDYSAEVQQSIGQARARLGVLRAEWAYLNRPDRLRELASINFERLGLLPLAPEQFGHADQVSYPRTEEDVSVSDAVEVSNMEALR